MTSRGVVSTWNVAGNNNFHPRQTERNWVPSAAVVPIYSVSIQDHQHQRLLAAELHMKLNYIQKERQYQHKRSWKYKVAHFHFAVLKTDIARYYFQQLFPKHQVICDLIFCRLINKTAVCTSCILFEMWTSTEEYVFWRTITVSRSKLNIQILNLASIDMLVN